MCAILSRGSTIKEKNMGKGLEGKLKPRGIYYLVIFSPYYDLLRIKGGEACNELRPVSFTIKSSML